MQCRVSSTAEDSLLERLRIAARRECESEIRRALITQDWEHRLRAFPADGYGLAPATVQAIQSVAYINTSGDLTTVSDTVYRLDNYSLPAALSLKYDQHWPTDIRDEPDAVRIVVRCGYGANAADVPEQLRQWILLRIATLWAHREQFVAGAAVAETPFVNCLLDSERVAEAY